MFVGNGNGGKPQHSFQAPVGGVPAGGVPAPFRPDNNQTWWSNVGDSAGQGYQGIIDGLWKRLNLSEDSKPNIPNVDNFWGPRGKAFTGWSPTVYTPTSTTDVIAQSHPWPRPTTPALIRPDIMAQVQSRFPR